MIIAKNGHGEFREARTLRPSDFHAHVRKDALMQAITKNVVHDLKYLLVMPNTAPTPITNIEAALAYQDEIMALAAEAGHANIELIMTLYHTPDITPAMIEKIARDKLKIAIKHYPPHPGATTGSGHGVPLWESDYLLDAMSEAGVPLLGHFESVYDKDGHELPHEEREAYYVENYLYHIRDRHPNLRISCEHGSTEAMVNFVKQDTSGKTVMTVTPQHLLFTNREFDRRPTWRNDLKCMPILKGPDDVEALRQFVFSGDQRAIAGTDTAPHPAKKKAGPFENAASGCFTPHAMALYALVFLNGAAFNDRYENFTALNGPKWWGLPPPEKNDYVSIRVEPKNDIPEPVPIPGTNDVVVSLGWTTGEDKLNVGLVMD